VRYSVPTGNFGDIFAGYAAMRAGLPVKRLTIATNSNDILARTLETGRYEPRPVVPTASPSMDIQISSNFERLIFEASGRDAARVRAVMAEFAENGAFTLSEAERAAIAGVFSAHRVDESETAATIARVYRETGYLADPHTAVGLAAAEREAEDVSSPMIALSTAHPAKFPDAMERAAARSADVPERLQKVLSGTEQYSTLDANADTVRHFIHERTRSIPRGIHS
jgi:threonine synthase